MRHTYQKIIATTMLIVLISGCVHDYSNQRRSDIVDDLHDNLGGITTPANVREIDYIKTRINHLLEECK